MGVYTIKHCINSKIWEWNWDELELCSNKELIALCQLMGIPFSGTKATKLEQLKAAANVRKILFNKTPEQLVQEFSHKELSQIAKSVGSLHYRTKYAIAVSLFNWQKNCNYQGMRALKEAKEAIKQRKEEGQPLQLHLDLLFA